jgi:hypothetical protein
MRRESHLISWWRSAVTSVKVAHMIYSHIVFTYEMEKKTCLYVCGKVNTAHHLYLLESCQKPLLEQTKIILTILYFGFSFS